MKDDYNMQNEFICPLDDKLIEKETVIDGIFPFIDYYDVKKIEKQPDFIEWLKKEKDGLTGYHLKYKIKEYHQRFKLRCGFCNKNNIIITLVKYWSNSKKMYTNDYSGNMFCKFCYSRLRKKYLKLGSDLNGVWHLFGIGDFKPIRNRQINIIRKAKGLKNYESFSESEGEIALRNIIEEIFPHKSILFRDRSTIASGELDIYIPELKLAFEFQGKQHFEFVGHFHKTKKEFKKLKERDRAKVEECKSKGIKLIEHRFDEPLYEGYILKKIQTTLVENY